MTSRVVTLALCLVLACSSDADKDSDCVLDGPLVGYPVTFSFDPYFPEALKDDVRWAITRWEHLIGCDAFREQELGGRIVIRSETLPHPLGAVGKAEDDLDERGNTVGGTIRLYPSWRSSRPPMRVNVVSHELGHVMGLTHGTEPGCLMFPVISPDGSFNDRQKPICRDERALVRKEACGS